MSVMGMFRQLTQVQRAKALTLTPGRAGSIFLAKCGGGPVLGSHSSLSRLLAPDTPFSTFCRRKLVKLRLAFHTVFVTLFLALCTAAVASNTWYVDGVDGNDNNNCKSRQHACKTIGHAISLASSGDSVKVAAATYKENLTIGINLKIVGASVKTTIIDGGRAGTVVAVASGADVTLLDLTIRNGLERSTRYGGGGIYNQGKLTIGRSTISGNEVDVSRFLSRGGGGIYNRGKLTIGGSTISGNRVTTPYNGSGVAQGGGIFNAGTVSLNDSTVSGNSATQFGDQNCVMTYGGGIFVQGGTLTLNNSTLSGNYALGCEGVGYGGGIYGSVILQNSIVANSPYGGNCDGTMTSNGYNLSSDNTCNFDKTGDLNNTDPVLGQLGNYGGPTQTIPLLSGSPAIDAGNPNGCTDGNGHLLKTDQRGRPRPDHEDSGGCDMGAYERQKD